MTWRHWLGYLVAFAGLKWIMGHCGDAAGAYVVAGLSVVILVTAYLRHASKQHSELMILQAEPDERARLLSALPAAEAATIRIGLRSFEDIDLAAAPPPVEFSYPAASRGLTALLFWASALCAAGMLVPIVRGTVLDWIAAGILIALALVFFVAALGYQLGGRWAGIKVRVDAEGVTEMGPHGSKQVRWTELRAVSYRRWPGALCYEGLEGQQIQVGGTLIDFAHFVELTLIHRYRASLLGAA
jgi:hypothetical protein